MMTTCETLSWKDDALHIIDQTKLPNDYCVRTCVRIEDVYDAIRELAVRGAPLLGVASAFGLYVGIKGSSAQTRGEFLSDVERAACYLASARPTAVNVSWALRRVYAVLTQSDEQRIDRLKGMVFHEAVKIQEEDRMLCRRIGEAGHILFNDGDSVLTHCNAGALATAGIGTALAPIYVAHEKGKKIMVYVDETRPLLQGARLTAWELKRYGVAATLICDSMAASLMRRGAITSVVVGADRIAANGDTANKIGTYAAALAAAYHHIPFYVAAPYSTFDFSLLSGADIPIEERLADEVLMLNGTMLAPAGMPVCNPAFDVTPAALLSAFITERGILYPPFETSLRIMQP